MMTDTNNNLNLLLSDLAPDSTLKSTAKKNTRKKLTVQEMLNFKGNVNENEQHSAEPRYSCPETGAHFEFENMCSRLEYVANQRLQEAEEEAGTSLVEDNPKLLKPSILVNVI